MPLNITDPLSTNGRRRAPARSNPVVPATGQAAEQAPVAGQAAEQAPAAEQAASQTPAAEQAAEQAPAAEQAASQTPAAEQAAGQAPAAEQAPVAGQAAEQAPAAEQAASQTPAAEQAAELPAGREALTDALLGELTAWRPQDRVPAFRMWHRSAFSLVHLNVVTVLQVEGPLAMSRLAEALDVSVASATGIVTRMERRGLVERRHATDDRRVVQVHLTEQGAGLFSEIERRRGQHLRDVIELLTDAELAAFLIGLRAVHAARIRLLAERGVPGGVPDDCRRDATAEAEPRT